MNFNLETIEKQSQGVLNHRRFNRQFLIVGIITFLYCIVPIIQFHFYTGIEERFNDHYIFALSMRPFELMEFIYTNSIFPYLSQLLIWLLYWVICYHVFKMLKK
jgi:hypothetical protein